MNKMCTKCLQNPQRPKHTYCLPCNRSYVASWRKVNKSHVTNYDAQYRATHAPTIANGHRTRRKSWSPYVYRVSNTATGTVYYGESRDRYRWNTHKAHSVLIDSSDYNSPFHTALRSSVDDFKFEILAFCENKIQARNIEKHLIEQARLRGKSIYNVKS